MHPILFHIGSFPIRTYGLAVAAARVVSSYFAAWLGRRRGLTWSALYTDFVIWVFLGGLVGARVWEVVCNWSFYRNAPRQIYALWNGGLSIQGGVLGGLVVVLLFTRWHKVPFGRFLDGLAPALLLGQGIGRLFGCTFNGDAFGKPTGTAFGIIHAPGTLAHAVYGNQHLWPAEVFEGVFDLALMAFMLRLGVNRGPAGRHFLIYAVLYSAGRFGLEFLRGDTKPVMVGLTAAQVGSLIVLFLCGFWLLRQARLRSDRSWLATGPSPK